MNNSQKAALYDQWIREAEFIQRENSKLKSENTLNIPPAIQKKISENEKKLNELQKKVSGLF